MKITLLTLLSFSTGAFAANPTLVNLPANTWYSAPNSKMQSVTPTYGQFPGTWAVGGPQAVVTAWGGGALDTKRNRMVVWGGGHADYYGNELYGFDIHTLTWSRITDPFVNPVMDQEVNADGSPNSRHTYGGLAYVDHADRFFGLAGSLAGVGFADCHRTWVFDFDNKQWTNRNPASDPTVGYGCYAAYDPESKCIWWEGGGSWGGLWSYNYNSNTWAKHNDDNFGNMASAVDTKRGLLFSIGNGGTATGGVIVYDIRGKNYQRQVWATTGGDAFINKSASGLAYDPVADRIVGWHGGAVYALDPDTKVWTAYNASGAPTPPSQGTFGRWRYVPGDNVFISVNSIDQNVCFYKLSAGGGTTALSTRVAKAAVSSVFPNPYRGNGNLSFITSTNLLRGTLRLFNVNGKEVASAGLPQTGIARLSESALRFLPAGIYVAELQSHGKTMARQPLAIVK